MPVNLLAPLPFCFACLHALSRAEEARLGCHACPAYSECCEYGPDYPSVALLAKVRVAVAIAAERVTPSEWLRRYLAADDALPALYDTEPVVQQSLCESARLGRSVEAALGRLVFVLVSVSRDLLKRHVSLLERFPTVPPVEG